MTTDESRIVRHVHITPQDLGKGLETGFLTAGSPEGTSLMEACLDSFEAGDRSAFFVPAVKVAIDGTFAVLDLVKDDSRLRNEVVYRQALACHIAGKLVKILTLNEILEQMYNDHPSVWRRQLPRASTAYFESLGDTGYLQSLACAPFFDARRVCGGALRQLQRTKEADPAAVIERSHGLLVISGTAREYQEKAQRYLGLPYVARKHLEVVVDDSGNRKVQLTDKARQQLLGWQSPESGCPAARVSPDETVSVLEQYWPKFVNYLVPPNATAYVT